MEHIKTPVIDTGKGCLQDASGNSIFFDGMPLGSAADAARAINANDALVEALGETARLVRAYDATCAGGVYKNEIERIDAALKLAKGE